MIAIRIAMIKLYRSTGIPVALENVSSKVTVKSYDKKAERNKRS